MSLLLTCDNLNLQTALDERQHTTIGRFLEVASRDPERVAYSLYPSAALKPLQQYTYGDWATEARAFAGMLLARHAKRGDRIAIFSGNRLLWPVTEMGAAMAGLITVGFRAESDANELTSRLSDCEPQVVVVDTLARFKLLRNVQSQLGRHFTIVCDDLDPLRTSTAEGVFEWDTWCRSGAEALKEYSVLVQELARRMESLSSDDVATIGYTASEPKGVLYSHRSLHNNAVAVARLVGLTERDSLLNKESLADVSNRVTDMHAMIHAGASAAMLESIADASAVARLFEPSVVHASARYFQKIVDVAQMTGEAKLQNAVQTYLGVRCRVALYYGSDAPWALQQLLESNHVELVSLYGLPEALCICANGPVQYRAHQAGKPIDEMELQLSAHGELMIRRNEMLFHGYWHREDETANAFTENGGWLRTGQRAEIDDAGFVRIAGDWQDLITLESGLKINPEVIEHALAGSPLISHAVCHGESRPHVVVVLSLKRDAVERWAFQQGLALPWEALVQHRAVREELAREVAALNAALPQSHKVRSFAVTEIEFTAATGELTESGSIARDVLSARFRHVFEELYVV